MLCHELTHNVWGDHDNNVRSVLLPVLSQLTIALQFKELNSQLNREVAEFERARSNGTHLLHDYVGEEYEPPSALEAEARAQVLGGLDARSLDLSESAAERRQRLRSSAD